MSVDGSTRRTPWVDAALLAPVVAALVVVFMGVGGVRPALVWHGGLIYLGVLLTLAVFVRGRSRLLDRLRTLCARYSTPSFEWVVLVYGCVAMVAGVVGMLDVDDTRAQKASPGQLEARLADLCSHTGPADAKSFSAVDQPPMRGDLLLDTSFEQGTPLWSSGAAHTRVAGVTGCSRSGQRAVEFVGLAPQRGLSMPWWSPRPRETILSASLHRLEDFAVQGRQTATLSFFRLSTSNHQPREQFNCDTDLSVFYRFDGGKWQHRMAFCGQHLSEVKGWRQAQLAFDVSGRSTIGWKLVYRSARGDLKVARYFIDDLRVEMK